MSYKIIGSFMDTYKGNRTSLRKEHHNKLIEVINHHMHSEFYKGKELDFLHDKGFNLYFKNNEGILSRGSGKTGFKFNIDNEGKAHVDYIKSCFLDKFDWREDDDCSIHPTLFFTKNKLRKYIQDRIDYLPVDI